MLIGSLVLLVWLFDDGLSLLYLQFCGEDRAGGRVQGRDQGAGYLLPAGQGGFYDRSV